jgi:cellulose synthase (UDP-forming)
VAIGANCVFRRAALESIGGHGVGLAEDLVTAVRLHARGWRSVYLPEVLSRGLVPEELGSYYGQQLKWARGVYEVLFAELPRCFGRLTLRQRLAYLGIGTYYLCGLTTLFYLVLPYLYLWIGIQPAAMRFEEFAIAGLPVAAAGTVIYLFAQRWLCHPAAERGLHWRGMFLKLACWPVYLLGTVLAVLRIDVRYTPTPKAAVRGRFLQLAWPHLMVLGAYAATMAHTLHARLVTAPEGALVLTSEAVWGMAGFATLGMLGSWTGVYAAWQAGRAAAGEPWAAVPRGPAAPAEGEAGGVGESLVSEGSAV